VGALPKLLLKGNNVPGSRIGDGRAKVNGKRRSAALILVRKRQIGGRDDYVRRGVKMDDLSHRKGGTLIKLQSFKGRSKGGTCIHDASVWEEGKVAVEDVPKKDTF